MLAKSIRPIVYNIVKQSSLSLLSNRNVNLLRLLPFVYDCNYMKFDSQIRSYRVNLKCPSITETSPELLLYWHPTKNNSVTPEQVTVKSFRKVWWKCPKGIDHEWYNCVRYVVNGDGSFSGCPFCDGKRVSITNSLSTKCPEIASQWHPTKNGCLLPSSVTDTSSKTIWWQCDKDPSHAWRRRVYCRVNPKTSTSALCPHCCKITMETRNLEVIHPDILSEWDYERNGELLPSHVSKSSAVRVWWKCSKGHEWQTSINNRTSSHRSRTMIDSYFDGIDCPVCSGRIISYERSLLYLYPQIAHQWHPTKNLPLTPDAIFPCSRKEVWWLCNGLPKSVGELEMKDLIGFGLMKKEGCGNQWIESVVDRVTKFKSSDTLSCVICSRESRRSYYKPQQQAKAKGLKRKKLMKVRVVGGRNNEEIIMVSSVDYNLLIGTGAFEAVDDVTQTSTPIQMKSVFGKKKDLYSRNHNQNNGKGHRVRVTIVNDDLITEKSILDDEDDDSEEEHRNSEAIDFLEDDLLLNGFDDSSDVHIYINNENSHERKSKQQASEHS